MKKLTDQEIQKLFEIELEKPETDDESVKAYHLVFSELKKEPAAGLPYNFSSGVISRVKLQQDLKADFRFYVLAFFAAIFIGCLLIGFLYAAKPYYFEPVLPLIAEYKWMIVFAVICFLLIKYLDLRIHHLTGFKDQRKSMSS